MEFWNFLRRCDYLEFIRADFHLTGLGRPGWRLYCKHPENKKGRDKLYIEDLPEEVKDQITGPCGKESCPIYKK